MRTDFRQRGAPPDRRRNGGLPDVEWRRTRHDRAMTTRRLLATAVLGLSLIATTPTLRVEAAARKPSGSKPVFTPQRLAGKYRWVKSTVKVTFAKGNTSGGDVPYGTNDTAVFVVKKVPGLPNANGTFTMNVASVGPSSGAWYLRDNGTRLDLSYDIAGDSTVAYRRIDQLDARRLTMSADDKLIVAAFNENGLNDDSNRNKVVGGSAYDELVRIP